MSVSLMKLKAGACCWPLGDPREKNLQFCGSASDPAVPYCDEHMALSRAPSSQRRKAS